MTSTDVIQVATVTMVGLGVTGTFMASLRLKDIKRVRDSQEEAVKKLIANEDSPEPPRPMPPKVNDTFWLDVVGIPLEQWCAAGTCHGPREYTFAPGVVSSLVRRREAGEFLSPEPPKPSPTYDFLGVPIATRRDLRDENVAQQYYHQLIADPKRAVQLRKRFEEQARVASHSIEQSFLAPLPMMASARGSSMSGSAMHQKELVKSIRDRLGALVDNCPCCDAPLFPGVSHTHPASELMHYPIQSWTVHWVVGKSYPKYDEIVKIMLLKRRLPDRVEWIYRNLTSDPVTSCGPGGYAVSLSPEEEIRLIKIGDGPVHRA